MNPDLAGIPFDHYQRYGAAASLVESLGGAPVERILEVGANRQRILKSFLPEARFVFSDLEPQPTVPDSDDLFVQADATKLPFADAEFDVVINLDVMEHIPPQLRALATSEMARVAGRAVIIGCPLDHPWVHEAEAKANGVWEAYFGVAYPWLDEHNEFGLVDPDVVESALRAAGMHTIRFGQGNVDVWAGMMGSHFVKEAVPELAGIVGAADRLYNSSVFAGDRDSRAYREFFVAVRDPADFSRLQASPFLNEDANVATKVMLAQLSDSLRPAVDRLRRAETEWSNTADVAHDFEKQLGATRVELAEVAVQRDTLAAERNGLATRCDDLVGQRDAIAAERDKLAVELAACVDALDAADGTVARADARSLELALSTGRLASVADSLRERNDELKQDLDGERRYRDLLIARVALLESRQRILAYALIVSALLVCGAAIIHRLLG